MSSSKILRPAPLPPMLTNNLGVIKDQYNNLVVIGPGKVDLVIINGSLKHAGRSFFITNGL